LRCVGGRRLDQSRYRGLDLQGAHHTITIRFAGTTFPARATLDVEPVILLARQRKQGLVKGPLDCPQGLLTRLLFFGALLLFDQSFDASLHGLKCSNQGGVALILNDSIAGTGGEV
jgi:hypothetical protein